jgi:hypothetical protein
MYLAAIVVEQMNGGKDQHIAAFFLQGPHAPRQGAQGTGR